MIVEGAYADLLLVDGNPLEDLDLVGDAEANFDLIMKDGKIYKNTLQLKPPSVAKARRSAAHPRRDTHKTLASFGNP